MRTDLQILLVEDDESIAFMLGYLLQRAGMRSRHASNALSAMQLLDDGLQPELFILDLVMPEIDGLQLLQWLRDTRSLTQPVLVLTGSTEPGLDERLLAAGASAVAHKPVDMPAILRLIETLTS